MDVWIEAIGFLGTGCAIAADAMRRMLPLRVAAVLSSVFFLAYGGLIGSRISSIAIIGRLPISPP